MEKGDIPFSERKVNRYLKERREEEEGRMGRMREMMVPEYQGRIDARLSLLTPELSEGMRVSWDYRGEKRYGTIVEVKGGGVMIRTDEGKEFIKELSELTPSLYSNNSYEFKVCIATNRDDSLHEVSMDDATSLERVYVDVLPSSS